MKYSILIFNIFLNLNVFADTGNNLNLKGDYVSINPVTKVVTLKGHARLTQSNHILTADQIDVNPKSGLVKANGDCHYENGPTSLSQNEISFKVQNTQWIYQKKRM